MLVHVLKPLVLLISKSSRHFNIKCSACIVLLNEMSVSFCISYNYDFLDSL